MKRFIMLLAIFASVFGFISTPASADDNSPYARLRADFENGRRSNLIKELDALHSATVSPLTVPGVLALEVFMEEQEALRRVPILKSLGARDIVVYPISHLVR